MKNRLLLLVVLLFCVFSHTVAQNIVKAEYFVDVDPGIDAATDVPITASISISNVNFSTNLSSLTDGLHQLYFRVQDVNGVWSTTESSPFYRLTFTVTTPPAAVNLTDTEYFIDSDPGIGNATMVAVTAGLAITNLSVNIDVSSLSDGLHKLFIRFKDANGIWGTTESTPFYKLTFSTSTLPPAANITKAEYFIDADPGVGAATNISVTAGLAITDLLLPVSVSSLSEGTHKLFVRFKDTNGTWSTTESTSFSVCNQAVSTVNSATDITSTGLTANWSAVSGASSYLLDISTDNFSTYVSGYNAQSVSANAQAVTSLAANTTYQIRVRVVGTCTSINSNAVTAITATATPVATAATSITSSGFTANWGAVTGATGYLVDVSTVSNFNSFVSGFNSATASGTSLGITGLTASTVYYFRIRASNGSPSTNSNSITATTSASSVPAAPVATAGTSITSTGFNANWGAVSGATGYQVDVSTTSNFNSFVSGYNSATASGTSLAVTGLTAGTTYYYQVRATSAGGTSANSNSITVTTSSSSPAPTAPVATAGTSITSIGFTANWATVSGATGYLVDVSTASNFSSFVSGYNAATASGTSLAITGLTAGTTYYYQVWATSAGGTSGNSNSITVTTSSSSSAPTAPVATAGTSITSIGFTANWGAVSGATGYLVDVSTASNFSSFVSGYNAATASGTSLAITGLTAGTIYYYEVRATSAGGASGNSNYITVTTSSSPPVAPIAIASTSITSTGFTANWGAVSGATGYQVDVSTASNFSSFVSGYNAASASGTLLAVAGLTAGTIYYYQVRATSGGGTSGNSNSITVTTASSSSAPAPPVATAGTSITSTGFTANWVTVTGATGYQFDVSTANDFSSFVSGYNSVAASSTSLAITGLTAGTMYFYQVRATNAGGTSVNSNVISVTTPALLQSQTITFGTVANVTLGVTTTIPLGATASSGLAVAYTSSDNTIATVSGSTLTIVGAGSCTITAAQVGNSAFTAATPVSQTFCVNPAQPTITLSGANTISPTLTSSAASGNQWFLNGTAISGATNSTLAVSQVGTYTVQVSVGTCQSAMSPNEVLIVTGDIKSISTTQGINLYPNPSRSSITIGLESLDPSLSTSIQIFDMLGRSFKELSSQGESTVSVDISNYAVGNYIVKVTQAGNIYHGRFTKQ